MKKLHVFSHRERPLANLLCVRLADEGIDCLIRNDELSTALGEIPFVECYPELWVVDEEVWPRARLLLDQWLARESQPGPIWRCPGCGEDIEPQFDACWQCGREKDAR